jgi:hypothetical protein
MNCRESISRFPLAWRQKKDNLWHQTVFYEIVSAMQLSEINRVSGSARNESSKLTQGAFELKPVTIRAHPSVADGTTRRKSRRKHSEQPLSAGIFGLSGLRTINGARQMTSRSPSEARSLFPLSQGV